MEELELNKDGMTSLEVAEVTGKEHKNVVRDIRKLLTQGVQELNFEQSFIIRDLPNGGHKQEPCFNLTPKGCLILASGYDAVLREKIINRLEQLEKNRSKPAPTLPDFTNPSEAARAWADQYDTAKTLMIENQGLKEEKQQLMKRNEALAKKATFADCVMQAENCITIAEMAQILHQNGLFNGGRGNLYKWMRLSGWLLSRGVRRNLPSQKAIKMGLMRVAEEPYQSNGSMAVNKYPVVTMKGQQYYLKIFGDDRMVDQRVLNFKN